MGCLLMFSTGENKELIYNLCIWFSGHFNNMFKQDFLWVQWLVYIHKQICLNFSKGVRYSHILCLFFSQSLFLKIFFKFFYFTILYWFRLEIQGKKQYFLIMVLSSRYSILFKIHMSDLYVKRISIIHDPGFATMIFFIYIQTMYVHTDFIYLQTMSMCVCLVMFSSLQPHRL